MSEALLVKIYEHNSVEPDEGTELSFAAEESPTGSWWTVSPVLSASTEPSDQPPIIIGDFHYDMVSFTGGYSSVAVYRAHIPKPIYIANEILSTITFFTTSNVYKQKLDWQTVSTVSYSSRNTESVDNFLEQHLKIRHFLEEIKSLVASYFSSPLEIVLDVMTYSKEGEFDELVGWIQSTDDLDTGLEKLEQLEESLDRYQDEEIKRLFHFNIEFK